MKEIYITGMGEMTGSHLAKTAVESGYRVTGTIRPEGSTKNIDSKLDPSSVRVIACDLTDMSDVRNLMTDINPDILFHLAGKTNATTSWKDHAYEANVAMLRNILEETRKRKKKPKVIFTSSASIYDNPGTEQYITEDHLIRPANPYGLSKKYQEDLLAIEAARSGLEFVIVRPANYTGPGRASHFVETEIGKQILKIEEIKGNSVIKVRNLAAEVDIADVRDITRALLLLSEKGKNGEAYNATTGRPITVRQLAILMTNLSQLIDKESVHVESTDEELKVKARFSNTKIMLLGWYPQIPLAQTLKDTLDWMRSNKKSLLPF